MRTLVTAKQMKAVDAHTIHTIGIPSMVLMERAALWVAEEAGALAGQNLVIEILLPVDIGRAVLQLLNGAAQLGMTREQARQIEASALRRLRRPSGPSQKG